MKIRPFFFFLIVLNTNMAKSQDLFDFDNNTVIELTIENYNQDVINVGGDIIINEFMADNETTQADQNDEYDDWIELYNNSNSAINLEGYGLSDNVNANLKWTFPDVTIEANGYLNIWADKDEDQEGLHANFKLSANGETLLLSNPEGTIIDQITYETQQADKTTGRSPNGTGDFTFMNASFNSENELVSNTESPTTENIEFDYYPNPVSDWLTFQFASTAEFTEKTIIIYDVNGRQIYNKNINNSLLEIDVSYYSSGIYYAKIIENGKIAGTARFVIE